MRNLQVFHGKSEGSILSEIKKGYTYRCKKKGYTFRCIPEFFAKFADSTINGERISSQEHV